MSDRLPEIEARMQDTCDRWNVLFAQSDRAYLVEEVRKLREELREARQPPGKFRRDKRPRM